jgi:broad specificity phosphatase PhoE
MHKLNATWMVGVCVGLGLLAGCQRVQVTSPSSRSLRIYLARHGQTDWNAAQRLQGAQDVPINENGELQARQLAAALRGVRLDAIYSSALQRSRKTAEVVAAGRPVVSVPELNEQALGRFEGVYLDGRDPATASEYHRREVDPDDSLDGGESIHQHLARVKQALEQIRHRHPSGQILIVGHGGTNVLILQALLDLTPAQAGEIHQANEELYLIELFPDRPPLLWKQIPPGLLNQL